MRGQMQHGGALAQGLTHQTQPPLRQITHPAVQELGGPRGCTAGKVIGLDQHDTAPFQRRLQSHPQTGGPTAHHQQITDLFRWMLRL